MSLDILILPISGGYFVSQAALVSKLLEAKTFLTKKRFDVHMGASGGNLVGLLSLHFNEGKESFERILDKIHSGIFVRNWFQGRFSFLPSYIAGVFSESLYKPGAGSEDMFRKLYKKELFLSPYTPEIWSLTFNELSHKGSLNCSKRKQDSILSTYIDNEYMRFAGCDEINYLDGDADKICNTANASGNIPGFRKSVEINGQRYLDGGLSRGSPGSLFTNVLHEKIKNENIPVIHYFYIQGPAMSEGNEGIIASNNVSRQAWLSDILQSMKHIVNASVFEDKMMCFEGWMRSTGKKYSELTRETYATTTLKKLKTLMLEKENVSYFMVCYISKDVFVDITNFTGKDAINKFREAYDLTCFDIFY